VKYHGKQTNQIYECGQKYISIYVQYFCLFCFLFFRSEDFSFESVGVTSTIMIPGLKQNGCQGESAIAYSIYSTPGKFVRTRTITFAPHYIIVNKLGVSVEIKQYKVNKIYIMQQNDILKNI
jgi:hypothetical protein